MSYYQWANTPVAGLLTSLLFAIGVLEPFGRPAVAAFWLGRETGQN
jgi:hypothetical protein